MTGVNDGGRRNSKHDLVSELARRGCRGHFLHGGWSASIGCDLRLQETMRDPRIMDPRTMRVPARTPTAAYAQATFRSLRSPSGAIGGPGSGSGAPRRERMPMCASPRLRKQRSLGNGLDASPPATSTGRQAKSRHLPASRSLRQPAGFGGALPGRSVASDRPEVMVRVV